MDENERKRLQELVDAVHETTRALLRSTAATGSWPANAGPGMRPVPMPGVGPNRTGETQMEATIMYGYGATNAPGIGSLGYWTLNANPFIPGYGTFGPMGLTHNGPTTPFGYGIPAPSVPVPFWGIAPTSVGFGNPGVVPMAYPRAFGLSHLGPEGFTGGLNAGWPTSHAGVPLTPAWTGGINPWTSNISPWTSNPWTNNIGWNGSL